MKTTAAKALAVTLSILACGTLLSGASARGCTVFCDSQGESVLAGRSYDIPDNADLGLLVVPATARTHGWICGGRFDYPWADGMNDQGLFVAVADVPTPYTTSSSRQPADLQTFVSGLLGHCASVEEAINWCTKRPTPHLYGWINHSLGSYTFVTPGHLLVADRSGDSVVFEWTQGKLKINRKQGRYQLMTNFLLSNPKAGNYPCPRYAADSSLLDKAAGPSLETCRQVLETTSAGSTRYSLICDLAHGDVCVYLRRRFDQPRTIHLADELKKGRHEMNLDQWFGLPKPAPLSPPPVIAPSSISAAEILDRALAARGGAEAAAAIRSIHAKGTLEIVDFPSLSALPVELFAMRPNRLQIVTDIIASTGPNLGKYVEGFDGRFGWNADVDGSCRILRDQEYQLRKDDADFFGWYYAAGNYQTAECLGEAQFDGKLCYDLKIVTRSRQEEFHYYDTTNYLLVGVFSHDIALGTLSSVKTTFSDYRAFGGLLLPTRFTQQDDWSHCRLRYSSLEINTVTNIPPVPLLAQLDPKTYDMYVGQFRKSFLFGLLHLGPTLSISHATDKQLGDHLVGSVRGLREFPAGYNAGDFFAAKDNRFVVDPGATDAKIELTFDQVRNGKATRVIVNWNGKKLSGARISAKPVE